METQQSTVSNSFTKSDVYVICLAAIALVLVMLPLLNDRLFFKIGFHTLGTHQKIAVTSHSVNDVRRRVDTDVMWLPLYNSDDVYESDTIYTGHNSETEVTLDNGVKFQLEPESLVVVHHDQIDLQQGKIFSSFKTPQKIKVTTQRGETVISGSNGQFKVEADDVGPKVSVSDGEVKLEDSSGQEEIVKKDVAPEKVAAIPAPVPVPVAAPVSIPVPAAPVLVFPKNDTSIELKKETTRAVSFQWTSADKLPKFKIQVASDANFTAVVWENEGAELNVVSKPLPFGNYFWRVQGENADTASPWSVPVTFKIAKAAPVEEPVKRAPPPPKPLRAPKIKNKHQTFKIDSFYRVNPKSTLQKLWGILIPMAQADDIPDITPDNKADTPPAAPSPTKAEAKPDVKSEAKSDVKTEAKTDTKTSALQKDVPQLDWEQIPGAAGYEVEVAEDSNFKNIVIKKTLNKNSIEWNNHKPGTFYWHVRGIDRQGRPGTYSELSSFDLILLPPKILPPVKVVAKSDKIQLQWNRVPFARNYEVQLSPDATFAKPTDYTTPATTLEVKPPRGAKYWRVKALTVPAQFNGKFTEPQLLSQEQIDVGGIRALVLKPLEKRPGIPVLFDPADNGVDIGEQQFDYEVTEKNEIRIGEIYIKGDAINLSLAKKPNPAFVLTWPHELFRSGRLTLKSADGKTLIETITFTIKDLSFKAGVARLERSISDDTLKKLGSHMDVKFCGQRSMGNFRSGFCSKSYTCNFENMSCENTRPDGAPSVTVKINGAKVPLKGLNPAKNGERITFESVGQNGVTLHLETQPLLFQVRDVVQQDEDTLVLAGNGALPFNTRVVEKDGFNWRTAVLISKPSMYVFGANSLVFKTDLTIHSTIPTEDQRAFIDPKSPTSTYSDELKLKGLFRSAGHQASSDQREAHMTSAKEFEWNFASPDKGDSNLQKITLGDGAVKSVGRYSIYRGYNFELSGRFTVAFTNANSPLVLGEGMGAAWFESIFGCEKPYLCYKRWGVTAKYFNTIVGSSNIDGTKTTLSGIDADIRYRLTSGISNQDESFGFLLGYQTVTNSGAQGSMGGIGAFWTKPMPSFADKIFNYFKWFRFPKVLDAEIQYYPLSLSSGTTLSPTFNVLFRGKMFLKPNFFLEGGLGYRQYGYQTDVFQVSTGLAFVTGGLGIDF